MEKTPVSFIAISNALCNKDSNFTKEVYNLLAQHILLGNLSAEDICFLQELEFIKRYGDKRALPIFANKEMLFHALINNVTTIPLISAYQNFFKFAQQQKVPSSIELIVQAHVYCHERVFCSMCKQFISQLPAQKPDVERMLLELSFKHSWLLPLELSRLKNLDVNQNYKTCFALSEDNSIEIVDYLLNFTQVTSDQAIVVCKQIGFRTDSKKHICLINTVLNILQKQSDNLNVFIPSPELYQIGSALKQKTFFTCCNILKQSNITNTDVKKNFILQLYRLSSLDVFYEMLDVYNSDSIIKDKENIDSVVQSICYLINDIMETTFICKHPLQIVKLSLSTLYNLLLKNDSKLHISSLKEIIQTISVIRKNKFYNIDNIIALVYSQSDSYDVETIKMLIEKWPQAIKKINLDRQQIIYFISDLILLQKQEPTLKNKIIYFSKLIINSSPTDETNYLELSKILLDTPFEKIRNIPLQLKKNLSYLREELNWQESFLQQFIP